MRMKCRIYMSSTLVHMNLNRLSYSSLVHSQAPHKLPTQAHMFIVHHQQHHHRMRCNFISMRISSPVDIVIRPDIPFAQYFLKWPNIQHAGNTRSFLAPYTICMCSRCGDAGQVLSIGISFIVRIIYFLN